MTNILSLRIKNRVDFISMPDGVSEKERLTRFAEALKKQGWTVTDKEGLLDKSEE